MAGVRTTPSSRLRRLAACPSSPGSAIGVASGRSGADRTYAASSSISRVEIGERAEPRHVDRDHDHALLDDAVDRGRGLIGMAGVRQDAGEDLDGERQPEPLVAAERLQQTVDLPAVGHLFAALAVDLHLAVRHDARRHVEHEGRRGRSRRGDRQRIGREAGAARPRRRDDLAGARVVRDHDPDLSLVGDQSGEVREPTHVAGTTNGDTRDAVETCPRHRLGRRCTGDDLAESELAVDRRGRALVAGDTRHGSRVGLAPLDRRDVPRHAHEAVRGVIGELARDEQVRGPPGVTRADADRLEQS